MSHQTQSDRNSARTQRRIALALTALFSPALLTAPASAEPQPWHNPEYVAESSASSRGGQLRDARTGPTSWASRSRCPVRTTATPPQPNKAQIEHDEQLAMTQPNKAQIEHDEQLAMTQRNKAQIEHDEQLAMTQRG